MKESERVKKGIRKLEEEFEAANDKPLAKLRIMRKTKRLEGRLRHLNTLKTEDKIPSRLKRIGSKWASYHWTMKQATEKSIARRRRNNKIAAKSKRINRLKAA